MYQGPFDREYNDGAGLAQSLLEGVKRLGNEVRLEKGPDAEVDNLIAQSTLGVIDTISRKMTPGCGAGHLASFGYDPLHSYTVKEKAWKSQFLISTRTTTPLSTPL